MGIAERPWLLTAEFVADTPNRDEPLPVVTQNRSMPPASSERVADRVRGVAGSALALCCRKLTGGQNEGPFCQRCLDIDSKAMRLRKCLAGVDLHRLQAVLGGIQL